MGNNIALITAIHNEKNSIILRSKQSRRVNQWSSVHVILFLSRRSDTSKVLKAVEIHPDNISKGK